MKKSILFSAIAALGLFAGAVDAAQMSHTLTINGVYNATTGALVGTSSSVISSSLASGQPFIYRVQINSSLSGVATGEAYGNELMDITYSGGAQRIAANLGSARANYVPNNPQAGFDANSAAVNTYQINADQGPSATDLKALTAVINNDPNNYNQLTDSAANPITDPRTTWAITAPAKVGTFDVKFDGSQNAWVTLGNASFSTLNTSTLTFNTAADIPNTAQPNGDPVVGSASLYFAAVPEPASLSLLGFGVLALAARRRHA